MQLQTKVCLGFLLTLISITWGAEPNNTPRPMPLTRPELKQLIEDVKARTPRIPLPELSDQDREKLGSQADNYESRLRYHFLNGIEANRGAQGGRRGGQPAAQRGAGTTGRAGGAGRDQDSAMTLDNAFKVELFWIVSRANNCQYCLGHQESKLLGAGLSEDRIAALDGDWQEFTSAERAAFAFARKFTYEPHLLNDADIVSLRGHYNDSQILEMILSMAGNNSINRWKEGVGVPQNKDEGGYSRMARLGQANSGVNSNSPSGTYLTPTSPAFEKLITRVAPIVMDKKTGDPTRVTVCERPELESRESVEKMLSAAALRASRLPLMNEEQSRAVLANSVPPSTLVTNWMRLLANFPQAGVSRISTMLTADEKGDLSPLLKAQLSWIIARQDRAWYAIGQSRDRLRQLGQSDEQIFALDGNWQEFSPREQSLFVVAKKLAASPVVLTDSEVAHAVGQAGARDVVQTVNYTTHRAAFNRITEAAGLPIEK